jgi:hypothetical protein
MAASVAFPAARVAPKVLNSVFGSDGSRETANRIVARRAQPNKTLDLQGVANDLKALAKTNPRLAQNAYAEILSRLKPVRQGELQRLVGKSLINPSVSANRSNQGQTVVRGTSIASDALHDSVKVATKAKGLSKLAPVPAKLLFASLDFKLKYDELRAKGFSHGAANAGATAGLASGLAVSETGAIIGGVVGGLVTSPSGPGAIGGAAVGGIAGSAASGAVDWYFEISDSAALKAANSFDHTHRR